MKKEIVCGRCGCVTEFVFLHKHDRKNPDNNVYQMGCCEEIVRGSELKTFKVIRVIERPNNRMGSIARRKTL